MGAMKQLQLGLGALFVLTACGGSVVAGGAGGHGTGAGTTGSGAGTTGTGAGATGTGASTTGTGAGTTGTGASTTGTGASGTGGSVGTSSCPGSEPTEGASCAGAPAELRCTYGASVRPECRSVWLCTAGSWTTTHSACAPTGNDCGTTEPAPQTVCTTMGDLCVYGDSICYCGCGGGPACISPIDWKCADPPTTPGCPAVVPNDGTPCTADGVQCTYGTTCTPSGAQLSCTGGRWFWNLNIPCPV
jgi:hypothetical protein